MPIKKPFIVKESQQRDSAHDFTLSRTEWEAAVFQNATSFSVVLFSPIEGRLRKDFDSFPEALSTLRKVEEECAGGARIIMYAITPEGHHVLLPSDIWGECLADWNSRQNKKE